MKTLEDAFHDELRDILSAEKQLTKALPKMIKKASSPELVEGLKQHLEETNQHVARLEKCFEILGKPAKVKKCEAMAGLITEAESMVSETEDPELMDAVIIACSQKVEHYEIATYGTLCTWAEVLGHNEIKSHLGESHNEEELTDKKLTKLSKKINVAAKV